MTISIYPSSPPELLFRSQKEAQNALSSHFFPRYVQDGCFLTSACNICHNSLAVCNALSTYLIHIIHETALLILKGMDFCLLHLPLKALNTLYPVNPINGQRQLNLISRELEKFLGDYLFFPLNTLGYLTTNEKIPYTDQKISSVVNEVVIELVSHNENLLNPPNATPFTYKAQSVASSQMNAFAVPGGNMVVFAGLVKELAREIQSEEIQSTLITFEDGSTATVDLTGVTLKDVLASLLGHEITHIASRHAMTLIFENILRNVLLSIGRLFLTQKMDQENDSVPYLLEVLQDFIEHLFQKFRSRENEFEADVTGSFLASEADYDPRGALYLQQFFLSKTSFEVKKFQELTEFLSTHPTSKKRLRAIFVALSTFAPESLQGKVSWRMNEKHSYDLTDTSLAIKAAKKTKELLNRSNNGAPSKSHGKNLAT